MFGICKIQIHIRLAVYFLSPNHPKLKWQLIMKGWYFWKSHNTFPSLYISLIMRESHFNRKKETNISQILKLKNSTYNVLLWCSHYYLFSPVTKSPNMVNLLMTFATKLLLSSIRTVQTNGCPWLQPVWTPLNVSLQMETTLDYCDSCNIKVKLINS